MGNSQTIQKINFEDVQYVLKNNDIYVLINTLNESEQSCLIQHTLSFKKEEELALGNQKQQNNNQYK